MVDMIKIRRPDDFHLHLRREQMLAAVLPFTTNVFKRAVVMGNTSPLIKTARDVIIYRREIKSLTNSDFEPIMSIMLTNGTAPETIEDAHEVGAKVLKLIPGGASTNSDEGVSLSKLQEYYPVLEKVQSLGMIFSVHFELTNDPVTGEEIPEIHREARAIPFLLQLVEHFPDLRIVVEHASCREMIQVVKDLPKNVAATLTAHHATMTWFDCSVVNGKVIGPLDYCKPIFKTELDRIAVAEAMTSGNPKFFLGSDSAPHLIEAKRQGSDGKIMAGIFTAPVVLSSVFHIFEWHRCLERVGDFTSRFGAEHYGLPLNDGEIIMVKKPWVVPLEHRGIPVFMGGREFKWQLAS